MLYHKDAASIICIYYTVHGRICLWSLNNRHTVKAIPACVNLFAHSHFNVHSVKSVNGEGAAKYGCVCVGELYLLQLLEGKL